MESSRYAARRRRARETAEPIFCRNREKIMKAAAASFEEIGYAATTIDEIARRSGLDRASIYYYFNGKKDILGSSIERYIINNIEVINIINSDDISVDEKIRKLIFILIDSYHNLYPVKYICFKEVLSHLLVRNSMWGKRISKLNSRFEAALVAMIEEGVDGGLLHARGNARLVAAVLVGLSNWSHELMAAGAGLPASEIAACVSDMVLTGLRKPSA